ncbi:MAG: hypothetical protein AAF611_19835, partial [Bacteroidota bacterium]
TVITSDSAVICLNQSRIGLRKKQITTSFSKIRNDVSNGFLDTLRFRPLTLLDLVLKFMS